MPLKKIRPNVYDISSNDWNRKVFDQLIPLPNGTSYNSYIVKGSEKTALIDSVYLPMQNELLQKLDDAGYQVDYIVSNHAEQDHSGSINEILKKYPNAKVLTNPKCKEFLYELNLTSPDKIIEVKDREIISLGDKTLEFIFTPWVHWPDTMVTYLKEDKILFTGDFFGSHLATDNMFVKDEKETYCAAKRYYAEIMMPFRVQIRKNLAKIENLDAEIYAPSHGSKYQNPKFIFDAYSDWTSDNVKNEVVIPYISMYDSTTKMVEYLTKKLEDKEITVKSFDLSTADTGELAMALVDAATLILGTSMVVSSAHPKAIYAASLVNIIKPKIKYISAIGSYGWAAPLVPKMVEQIKSLIPSIKAEFIEPYFAKGHPKECDFISLDKMANEIIEKHKNLFYL
ncbi:MAG: FprA family A-type flavoprotein [Candidatus Gastranaerophilales bacterium]|nr:FprA family A-type flavoprotein [Candidatus Gastranaerophilales bacterium]